MQKPDEPILEANAFANEFLSKFRDIEKITDACERAISLASLERDLKTQIKSSSLSEYTVIIYLASLHFPELSSKELLVFVSTLVRFSLNIGTYEMSTIGMRLQSVFRNKSIGGAIGWDMSRSSSRYVVTFETILLLHGWLKLSNKSSRTHYLRLLRETPELAIKKFWKQYGVEFDSWMYEAEWEASVERLSEVNCLEDFKIVQDGLQNNLAVLSKMPPGLVDFKNLRTIDLLLEDDTVIQMPGRINLDVVSYFDENIELLCKLESIYFKEKAKKAHMPPAH